MSSLWILIYEFFMTGLFAIGGGLATIPFLTEMAEKYGWFTTDMLSTMIAVSESTPGAMGINMATYVGYITNGLAGGLIATLSLVAPSIIIICIIAKNYQKFKDSKLVKELFVGLKPAVVAFIVDIVSKRCIIIQRSVIIFSLEGNSFIDDCVRCPISIQETSSDRVDRCMRMYWYTLWILMEIFRGFFLSVMKLSDSQTGKKTFFCVGG